MNFVRTLQVVATGSALMLAGTALLAQAPANGVEKLYIMNCAEGVAGDISRWSPGVNVGVSMGFVDSCYLIKHDNDYLLWDTGHAMTAPNVAPKESIPDQIAKGGLKPEQIKFVGISHYHADHTGQVASRATIRVTLPSTSALHRPE